MKNDENESQKTEPKFHLNAHIIIIAIIAIVAIVAAFKLIKWNIGEESDYDPTEDTSQFDTETEDYIMVVDPQILQGYQDDGVTTILNLGNEPFASERGNGSISKELANLTDSTVYNGAFNSTFMSCKNTIFNENYSNDAFSLFWLAKSLTLNDFTLQENHLETFQKEDSGAKKALDELKSIDMNKVDVITIMYDARDYLETRITTSPYDLGDVGTCTGALSQSLTLLQEVYPHIRIIVLSPTFANFVDENGNQQSGGTYNNRIGFLSDYMTAYKNIAVEYSVSFIDNYYGTITESNYKEYLEDHINLNKNGRKLIAQRIAKIL